MSSHPSNDPEGSEPNKGDDTNVDANGNSSFDDADSKLNRSKHGPPNRPFKRSGSQVFLPRLINRNLPYHQSTNQIQVKNKSYKPLLTLMWRDWFHILLRTPPYFVVPLLLAIWTVTTVVWAQIYVFVDRNNFEADCGLGEPGFPIEFGTGFAFSLITVSTVGYGLPGSAGGFFSSNCPGLKAAVYFQMVFSMFFNAFLIAFFYSQISKAESRSIQLVFADKLCINMRRGRVYASARCYDLDSAYPVVECHARMYLLDDKLKLHQLRICSPNDELNAMMYPSLPQTFSHNIDHHSALAPRKLPLVQDVADFPLRSLDSESGSREEWVCPVCGETFGTHERLVNHIKYMQVIETRDGIPKEGSHLGVKLPAKSETVPITLQEVQLHIERTLSEIIVICEAIDPQLSGTFQALQSYRYSDIEFGADFAPCLYVKENKFVVDMKKFHDVVPDYVDDDEGNDEGIDQSSVVEN